MNPRPLHYQWSALPLSYRSIVGPVRTLGRRRACAIGSGAWQAMMGGKGGLGVLERKSIRRGVRRATLHRHGHARPPLPRACNLAYPEAPRPQGPPETHERRDPSQPCFRQTRPCGGAQVRSAGGRAIGGGLAGESAPPQATGQGAAFGRGPQRGRGNGLSHRPHPEGAKAPPKGQFPSFAPCFGRAARLIAADAPDSRA